MAKVAFGVLLVAMLASSFALAHVQKKADAKDCVKFLASGPPY